MNDVKQIFISDNSYFGEATIHGIPCIIGYKKEFRWSWFACQLNIFVIIGQTQEKTDAHMMDEFSAASYSYALKNHRGWPRGLQSGVGSIAILCTAAYDIEAAVLCEKATKKTLVGF